MELENVERMSTATIQLATMSVIVILVSLDLHAQVYLLAEVIFFCYIFLFS